MPARPPPGTWRPRAKVAGRVAVALLLGSGFMLAQVAAHEYLHCAFWWARGSDEPCTVVFAKPGHYLAPMAGGGGMGDVGRAYVEGAPDWEHPVMYAGHLVATMAAGFALARYLAGPVRAAPRPAPRAPLPVNFHEVRGPAPRAARPAAARRTLPPAR